MANPLNAVRVMGTIILFRSHICISETVTCPKDADCECVGDEPCVLNCIGKDYCKGGHTLTCRASQPCTLLCSGEQACTDSIFVGNGASSVSVQCTGGKACSGNTEIVCARDAPCSVSCDSGNCESLDIAANAASSFECTGNGCSLTSSAPAPYAAPTSAPSSVPSLTSSANPSTMPSLLPTSAPSSATPTRSSSVGPTTAVPTTAMSSAPSALSTTKPTFEPSSEPSFEPTTEPTTEHSSDISQTDDDEYIDIVFVSISSAALCVFTLCLFRNCAQQRKRQPLADRNSAPSPKHVQQPSDETDLEAGQPQTPDVTPPSYTTSPQPTRRCHILDDSDELDEIAELDKIDKPSTICGCTKSRLKKAYLCCTFVLTFVLLFLKQFVSSVDEYFDEGQAFIVNWFEAHHWLHILLVILLIAVAKGVGIKDPLSLRTMAVVILACQAAENNAARYVIAALIMSFQSSMAKLLEYYLVGDELQVVMGTPVQYVFRYARKALSLSRFCSEDSLKWLNPKWTLEISHNARNNPDMHIMNNFKSTFCKRRGGNVFTRGALWMIEFVLCVVWTSMIEWVSPISELFLYMHNWDLRPRNVLMIVCSELADFDRMIELGIFLSAYPDLLGGKVDSLVAKPLAWAFGYMLVMPLTLCWAYKYYPKAQVLEQTKAAQENATNPDGAVQGELGKSRQSLSYSEQAMKLAQTDGEKVSDQRRIIYSKHHPKTSELTEKDDSQVLQQTRLSHEHQVRVQSPPTACANSANHQSDLEMGVANQIEQKHGVNGVKLAEMMSNAVGLQHAIHRAAAHKEATKEETPPPSPPPQTSSMRMDPNKYKNNIGCAAAAVTSQISVLSSEDASVYDKQRMWFAEDMRALNQEFDAQPIELQCHGQPMARASSDVLSAGSADVLSEVSSDDTSVYARQRFWNDNDGSNSSSSSCSSSCSSSSSSSSSF